MGEDLGVSRDKVGLPRGMVWTGLGQRHEGVEGIQWTGRCTGPMLARLGKYRSIFQNAIVLNYFKRPLCKMGFGVQIGIHQYSTIGPDGMAYISDNTQWAR